MSDYRWPVYDRPVTDFIGDEQPTVETVKASLFDPAENAKAAAKIYEYQHPLAKRRHGFDRYIQVEFQWEGMHRWKDAPEQVRFLRNWHRHMFHAKCEIEVKHDDRELEYFMVLDVIKTKILPFISGSEDISSCEQMAEFIANGLLNEYGEDRFVSVGVFEDDENGSWVNWRPTEG